MTITPVAPIHREKLVPTSTSILIDFTGTPTLVLVDMVVVFDGSFQSGWLGSLLNKEDGGKRLVLDPPTDFALGAVVDVDVTEDGIERLFYIFEAGTTRITTTDDAGSPRVTDAGGSPYVAYVRDPGELFLRRDDPLTPEIKVVDGEIVDMGYDATLNKLVIFFVNNGKIFVTTADPGDGPTTITQPSALYSEQNINGPGSAGQFRATTINDFTPIKLSIPTEQMNLADPGSSGTLRTVNTYPHGITPQVIGLDPRIVRLSRPSQVASSTQILGFIPIKFTQEASRRLDFVPLPEGVQFVDFEDPVPNPDARYFAIPVYYQSWDRKVGGTFEGPRGGAGTLPLAADVFDMGGSSAGQWQSVNITDFVPIKLSVPLDTMEMESGGSSGRSFSVTQTGFPPIGVG